jgi:hypothetical protein
MISHSLIPCHGSQPTHPATLIQPVIQERIGTQRSQETANARQELSVDFLGAFPTYWLFHQLAFTPETVDEHRELTCNPMILSTGPEPSISNDPFSDTVEVRLTWDRRKEIRPAMRPYIDCRCPP